ncbi:acetylglutamate kinase [Chloroflexota bacterium]
MDKVIVVKLGGVAFSSSDTTVEDIVNLQRQGRLLVVVHGGGKLITEWLAEQGIPSRFVRGERVTDRATLEVVISVLAGLVNKDIVAAVNSLGGQAVGISGVDGALIRSEVKNVELGYVGRVVKVNLALLETLLQSGYIPVIAPLGLLSGDKPDRVSQILNLNADVIAGEIAVAIGAEKLIFLTDVVGVCDQQDKLLPQLSPSEAETLMVSGVASGGMIPKIKACLRALSDTLTACIMDGRQPHSLLRNIEEGSGGTIIKVGPNG